MGVVMNGFSMIRRQGDGILVEITDAELLKLSSGILEATGKMVTAALQRRQAVLLCTRDGHRYDDLLRVGDGWRICSRCTEVDGELPRS